MSKNSSEDWLSCTIRTVEAIMERHGFQEDEKPAVALSTKPSSDKTLSPWNKLRRAAALFRASE